MSRSALPLKPGAMIAAPISQSASVTVCPSAHCLTIEPNTSDIDSFNAPGLILIGELRRELSDAMGQFMCDDIQRGGETLENHAIAVAIHHLPAIPECIVVVLAVMNRRDQRLPMIVHGLAPKYLL